MPPQPEERHGGAVRAHLMVSAILPASSSPTRSTVSGCRWNCRLSFFTHVGIVALHGQTHQHGRALLQCVLLQSAAKRRPANTWCVAQNMADLQPNPTQNLTKPVTARRTACNTKQPLASQQCAAPEEQRLAVRRAGGEDALHVLLEAVAEHAVRLVQDGKPDL